MKKVRFSEYQPIRWGGPRLLSVIMVLVVCAWVSFRGLDWWQASLITLSVFALASQLPTGGCVAWLSEYWRLNVRGYSVIFIQSASKEAASMFLPNYREKKIRPLHLGEVGICIPLGGWFGQPKLLGVEENVVQHWRVSLFSLNYQLGSVMVRLHDVTGDRLKLELEDALNLLVTRIRYSHNPTLLCVFCEMDRERQKQLYSVEN